jgi:hypothetical protein
MFSSTYVGRRSPLRRARCVFPCAREILSHTTCRRNTFRYVAHEADYADWVQPLPVRYNYVAVDKLR